MQPHEKIMYEAGLARYLLAKGFFLKKFTVGRSSRFFYWNVRMRMSNRIRTRNLTIIEERCTNMLPCQASGLVNFEWGNITTDEWPTVVIQIPKICHCRIR